MNRPHSLLSLFCLLACAAAVRPDVKEDTKLLAGRWETRRKVGERELRGEMEFTANGKASMTVKGPKGDVVFPGTWKLLASGKLEITFTIMDNARTETYQMKVTRDTLELTGKDGDVQKMTRLR